MANLFLFSRWHAGSMGWGVACTPLLCVGVPLCLASGHRSAGQEETGQHGLDRAHPTCPGLTSLGTFSALRIERKMPWENSSCVAPGVFSLPVPHENLRGGTTGCHRLRALAPCASVLGVEPAQQWSPLEGKIWVICMPCLPGTHKMRGFPNLWDHQPHGSRDCLQRS